MFPVNHETFTPSLRRVHTPYTCVISFSNSLSSIGGSFWLNVFVLMHVHYKSYLSKYNTRKILFPCRQAFLGRAGEAVEERLYFHFPVVFTGSFKMNNLKKNCQNKS